MTTETRACETLDAGILRDMFWFNASLGLFRCVKGIDYVRAVEFPLAAECLMGELERGGDYLDVGSGDSLLPTYIAARTPARVTALDKFQWVTSQYRYLRSLRRTEWLASGRFSVVQEDFLRHERLAPASFDAISAVSVLEHIEGHGDSRAVAKAFDLLRPGGLFFVSCPYNHDRAQDFRVDGDVYGELAGAQGAFFQRHYSAETFTERILGAAPFDLESRFYASHYDGFNFAKRAYILDWPWKALKVFYNWATPFYAPRFLKVSDVPPSDPLPQMLTADTVFAVLRKPEA